MAEITQDTRRFYYEEPKVLEIDKHAFMTWELCVMQTSTMHIAW